MTTTQAEHAGRMVRAARRRHGWSQAKLARQIELSRQQVTSLETSATGAPTLTVALVNRLATALEIYPEALSHPAAGIARLLRGRVALHFLSLGQWHRLSEVLHHVLHDAHRMRPDVVGLSLLLTTTPHKRPRAYNAALQHHMYGEAPIDLADPRLERSVALRAQQSRYEGRLETGPRNSLTPATAPIAGAEAKHVLEYRGGEGTMWLALTSPPSEEDLHLDKVAFHLADAISAGVSLIRERHDRPSPNADITELREQVQQLQARVEAMERGGAG